MYNIGKILTLEHFFPFKHLPSPLQNHSPSPHKSKPKMLWWLAKEIIFLIEGCHNHKFQYNSYNVSKFNEDFLKIHNTSFTKSALQF
jgi:hypothetical protein